MKTIITALLVFFNFVIIAQDKSNEVKENDFFTMKSQYYYDSFVPGVIYFKDGNTANGELNYNVVVGEFHYIEDGILKTFSEFDLKRISKIVIGSRQFLIKEKTIYEVVYADKMLLLLKRTIKQEQVNQNAGAYGTSANTSTNTKITALSYAIGHEMEKGALVNIKDELNDSELDLEESYKLLYNNQLYSVSKKTFYSLYPEEKDKIKDFLKENRIKLKDLEDVVKVIEFCRTF